MNPGTKDTAPRPSAIGGYEDWPSYLRSHPRHIAETPAGQELADALGVPSGPGSTGAAIEPSVPGSCAGVSRLRVGGDARRRHYFTGQLAVGLRSPHPCLVPAPGRRVRPVAGSPGPPLPCRHQVRRRGPPRGCTARESVRRESRPADIGPPAEALRRPPLCHLAGIPGLRRPGPRHLLLGQPPLRPGHAPVADGRRRRGPQGTLAGGRRRTFRSGPLRRRRGGARGHRCESSRPPGHELRRNGGARRPRGPPRPCGTSGRGRRPAGQHRFLRRRRPVPDAGRAQPARPQFRGHVHDDHVPLAGPVVPGCPLLAPPDPGPVAAGRLSRARGALNGGPLPGAVRVGRRTVPGGRNARRRCPVGRAAYRPAATPAASGRADTPSPRTCRRKPPASSRSLSPAHRVFARQNGHS